jgi:hypothetical protein
MLVVLLKASNKEELNESVWFGIAIANSQFLVCWWRWRNVLGRCNKPRALGYGAEPRMRRIPAGVHYTLGTYGLAPNRQATNFAPELCKVIMPIMTAPFTRPRKAF